MTTKTKSTNDKLTAVLKSCIEDWNQWIGRKEHAAIVFSNVTPNAKGAILEFSAIAKDGKPLCIFMDIPKDQVRQAATTPRRFKQWFHDTLVTDRLCGGICRVGRIGEVTGNATIN